MLVHFEGRDYQFDLDDIDLAEARFIKRQSGLTLYKFQEGIIESDPDCLALAYWLMLKQNGEKMQDPSKMNFKVGQFSGAIGAAYAEEIKRREELELGGGADNKENPTEDAGGKRASKTE